MLAVLPNLSASPALTRCDAAVCTWVFPNHLRAYRAADWVDGLSNHDAADALGERFFLFLAPKDRPDFEPLYAPMYLT
eukprot:4598069-Prymnesium_polylepis.1